MDDFLEAARSGASGTVADFSGWNGIRQGDFKHMKIHSSEKVIEPVENEEINEDVVNDAVIKHAKNIEVPEPRLRDEPIEDEPIEDEPIEDESIEDEKPKQELKDRPGVQQAYMNPNELKNIAIKLMPTADKLMHNIHEPVSRDAMRNVSETAINLAFEFLQVWNEKVSVE